MVLTYIVAGIILLVFLYIAWKVAKKLIVNSIIGLIILGVLYLMGVKFIHWFLVFVITVIFGIPGILVVLILQFFGVPV